MVSQSGAVSSAMQANCCCCCSLLAWRKGGGWATWCNTAVGGHARARLVEGLAEEGRPRALEWGLLQWGARTRVLQAPAWLSKARLLEGGGQEEGREIKRCTPVRS